MFELENDNGTTSLADLEERVEALDMRLFSLERGRKVRIALIRPWSLAKVLAPMYFVFGLAFEFLVLLDPSLGQSSLTLPFVTALAGLVTGLILASLYNLAAILLGGIQIELEPVTEE